ncbi:hypothetical protein BKA61DRAFT_680441 [Leptodontidium sp. MPI-SDFR-AT-0119]|nr:hypothetical protein BKA61DRAFT_680441 [Leptodontidium sp. MPI-SDFR-AT-0119]
MEFMDKYVSASVGAGIVIFLESEYSAWRLFQRRKTLFFYVCQLAILSSALFNGISAYAYFTPAVEIVPLYTINTIVEILMVVSYPTMILLRLRLICHLRPLVLCAPMLQGILWLVLGIYQTKFALTKDQHFYRVAYILQLTGIVILMVQDVIINVFFVMVARKNFSDVIHIRSVIAVNMMVITLQIASVVLTFLFFYIDNSVLKAIPVIEPIKVRLEIMILAYIAESCHTRRRSSPALQQVSIGFVPPMGDPVTTALEKSMPISTNSLAQINSPPTQDGAPSAHVKVSSLDPATVTDRPTAFVGDWVTKENPKQGSQCTNGPELNSEHYSFGSGEG